MLERDGVDPTLHPATTAALKRIVSTEGDLTLEKLETLRRIAKDAATTINPADKRLAMKVVDDLDDYMANLADGDILSGDAAGAVSALKEARGLWSRARKTDIIDELMERAEDRSKQFSGSGLENAIRTEFRSLSMNAKRMRTFTPEERAAIKKVAQGGKLENALRMLGKFAPTGPVSGALGGIAGSGIGSAVVGGAAGAMGGAAALPALGALSRYGATKLTTSNALRAQELMRRGPLQESNATLGELIAAEQAQRPQVAPLALPSPVMLADSQGNVGTASAREGMGLTADVIAAARNHPGLAREQAGPVTAQLDTGGPSLADELTGGNVQSLLPKRAAAKSEPVASPTTAADEIAALESEAQQKKYFEIDDPTPAQRSAESDWQRRYNAAKARLKSEKETTKPIADELALDAPQLVGDEAGVGAAAAHEQLGPTPDVIRAAKAHPGRAQETPPPMKTAAEYEANAPAGAAIEFSGDEIGGLNQSMFDLKSAARKFAREHFADKSVVNEIDGTEINIPWQAIKHSTAGKVSKNAAIAISKLDELLTKAEPTGKAPDKQGRKDIAGAYYYDANISVGGEPAVIRAVVREHKDGHRYYDHFELLSGQKKSPAPGGGLPVQEVSGAFAGRKNAQSGIDHSTSGALGKGEHIELSGRDIKRRQAPIEHIRQGRD